MSQKPRHVPREETSRDGLAAVAIVILAVVLIVFVVSQLI